MGLLNQTQQAYYAGNDFGNYQFTSLDNIINQFMVVYVGEDKVISKIKRTDVAFHAQRAMQELSFDTFKSCKSQEITVPASLQMILPQDYVNYTKISRIDSAGIKHLLYPTSKTSNPTKILQNSDGSYYSNLVSNGDFTNNINGWSFHNVTNIGSNATHLHWSTSNNGVLISSNGIGEDVYPKLQQLITFEDGEEYTFEYNVTSISSNYSAGAGIKIWLYADTDPGYKPVEIQPTTTGSGTATFTWNSPKLGLNKGWLTIELPFGHTWFKKDQYIKTHPKEFKIAHLCGKLLKTYGHSLRHEILARENELTNPTKFYDVYGDRYNIEEARIGKEEIFGNVQYGVAIENVSHRVYFSEKILDCFLLKTIPIYWGCTNISDYFNKDGVIKFGNVYYFIYITNKLDKDFYNTKKEIIEENYQLALKYVDYEKNIINKITEIFKHNNLT